MGDKPLKRNPWEFNEATLALLVTHHFTLLLLMAAMLGILVVEIAAGNKKIARWNYGSWQCR